VGRELILAAPWIWRRGQQGGKSRMRFAFLMRTLGAECKQILNGQPKPGVPPLDLLEARSYKLKAGARVPTAC